MRVPVDGRECAHISTILWHRYRLRSFPPLRHEDARSFVSYDSDVAGGEGVTLL